MTDNTCSHCFLHTVEFVRCALLSLTAVLFYLSQEFLKILLKYTVKYV